GRESMAHSQPLSLGRGTVSIEAEPRIFALSSLFGGSQHASTRFQSSGAAWRFAPRLYIFPLSGDCSPPRLPRSFFIGSAAGAADLRGGLALTGCIRFGGGRAAGIPRRRRERCA